MLKKPRRQKPPPFNLAEAFLDWRIWQCRGTGHCMFVLTMADGSRKIGHEPMSRSG